MASKSFLLGQPPASSLARLAAASSQLLDSQLNIMTSDTLNGFPSGYFVIRAPGSYHKHSDRHMQLAVVRSEKCPDGELILQVENTNDLSLRGHIKHALDHLHGDAIHDNQVFFVSEDGVLRSKSSGHPIGYEFDGGSGMGRLAVQPPRPFNQPADPAYQFEYDAKSKSIALSSQAHSPCVSPQSALSGAPSLTSVDSSDSGIGLFVTPDQDVDCSQNYLLEFVPRQHRHSSFSQFFDRLVESPTEDSNSYASFDTSSVHSLGQVKARNNSWNENRGVRLVHGSRRHPNPTQLWEIVRVD